MDKQTIQLQGGNLVFTQEKDCCSDGDDYQTLEVEIHDGGGGKYFLIKTEGWAFDSVEELAEILSHVKLAFDF